MDEEREIDDILKNYFKNNPSYKKEWDRLKDLDGNIQSDFDDMPPDQLESIKTDCMDILDNAKKSIESSKPKNKWYGRRPRLGIAVAAGLLIFFFAFTSSGRAIAKSVYEAVVTFFGGDMHVEMHVPESDNPKNTDFDHASFNNLHDASVFLGYPLIGIDDSEVELKNLDLSYNEGLYGIEQEYHTANGGIFLIIIYIQTNGDTMMSGNIDASGGEPFEHTLFNGMVLHCNTTKDGNCMGTAIWDNIDLTIMSDNMSWEQLIYYIDKMRESNI